MKLYKTKKNCGKLLLGILAFCTGMILLTGCGSSSEQKQNKNEETAEENKEEDKVQIGLTVDSFVIERWIRDRDVFVATARELGAEVNVQDAGADVKEQLSQLEYYINKQVDVIVVIARDCGALSDAIQKAQSAGIPVISYDRLLMNGDAFSYFATFDNYKVGQKIKFPMADGGKVEEQTLIYRGKKNFKMEESKTKYRCLVFSFVEYEDGKEKEVVTFYITDDKNHLPVRLDMYLRFGSAKAFLTDAKGVRNPQTAIIK